MIPSQDKGSLRECVWSCRRIFTTSRGAMQNLDTSPATAPETMTCVRVPFTQLSWSTVAGWCAHLIFEPLYTRHPFSCRSDSTFRDGDLYQKFSIDAAMAIYQNSKNFQVRFTYRSPSGNNAQSQSKPELVAGEALCGPLVGLR